MQTEAVPKHSRMRTGSLSVLRPLCYAAAEMEQIMATIAEQFVCYQYDDRKYPFCDGGWDLFFWCNCFFNTMPGHGLMAEIIPTSRSASMSSTQQKRGKRSAIPSWL